MGGRKSVSVALFYIDIGVGLGLAEGVGVGEAKGGLLEGPPAPGKHGWATVVEPTAGPGVLRLVLPTTVVVPGEAPPTVAPTAGMPVVAPVPVGGVVPAAVAAAPGLHGPEIVLMVDPIVLFGAGGSAPTGLVVVVAAAPPDAPAPGVVAGVWLGVVVVVWLGVVIGVCPGNVVWLGVEVVLSLGVWPGVMVV